MASSRKHRAILPAILGVLLLVLTVAVFAEKSHGDHLPERNRTGPGATTLSGIAAGIVAVLISLSASSGNNTGKRSPDICKNPWPVMRRSAYPPALPGWPMRWPDCRDIAAGYR